MNEELDNTEESLVGRTITRALLFDESPKGEWAHHETYWLWLDDGRVMQFSSYGYDADGATLDEIKVMDIDDCLHCHKPHKARRVHEPYGTDRAPMAYCDDGNHKAWVGEEVPSSSSIAEGVTTG